MSHALLSPSGASRWLACSPSARLEEKYPDRSSSAADEGTAAHALAELRIQWKMGRISKLKYMNAERHIIAGPYFCKEMDTRVGEFLSFVTERYLDAQNISDDAVLYTETRLDMTAWVPEGFGTADVIIIADGVLEIIDLKYGKGVPVSAERNKQMMLYALGAWHRYDMVFGIDTVRMTIYQPRIDNISTYEMSSKDLLAWGEETVKPASTLAFAGKGAFSAGAHCRFCKAAGSCKANADFNLETVKHDFCEPGILNETQVSEILQRADLFRKWLTAVEDHALHQALNGKAWPDMKLVQGRSVRKIADEVKAIEALEAAGYKPENFLKPTALETLTNLEKNIGKAPLANALGHLITKPEGAPTLVHKTDKRPVLSGLESAKTDFS